MAGSPTRRTALQILAVSTFGSVSVAQAASNADARLVGMVADLIAAGKAEDELLEAYPDTDCNDVPGYTALEARQAELLQATASLQAESTLGLQAKARAAQAQFTIDCSEMAEALGASIAADILRLFPMETVVMRPLDPQAVEACHIVVDELRATAAHPDADLTPAERRHLLAIAAAVRARIEPKPQPAAEAAEPHPG